MSDSQRSSTIAGYIFLSAASRVAPLSCVNLVGPSDGEPTYAPKRVPKVHRLLVHHITIAATAVACCRARPAALDGVFITSSALFTFLSTPPYELLSFRKEPLNFPNSSVANFDPSAFFQLVCHLRSDLLHFLFQIVQTQLKVSVIYGPCMDLATEVQVRTFTRCNPPGTYGINDCSRCIDGIGCSFHWG